ncbi:MAG: ABC transporter permease subunit [Aliidongia sp.]
MGTIGVILRRELVSYFTMPLAYVFIVIFLVLAGAMSFYMGGFFEHGQADLQVFFSYHAFLYLFLIPALSMRLWAEERKTGTIELFLTLPITTSQAVLGKYLAAWVFTGIALALTFPFWITVNVLGNPDNGVILASYLGSFLMAGAFLAIGAAISAACKNQVIAFVLSATVCFLFIAAGSTIVLGPLQDLVPGSIVAAVANLSFIQHFSAIERGVLDLRDLIYFGSVIVAFLFANTLIVELKKAD